MSLILQNYAKQTFKVLIRNVYSSSVLLQKVQQSGQQTQNQKKFKESPKITLIQQNQHAIVTSLEEARNLAKRRAMHLKLQEELDAKTQRPIYKLVTSAEILQDELSELKSQEKTSKTTATSDKSNEKKSEKSLSIGSRIAEHDLQSRLKNISKWLEKGHEVRILLQGNAGDASGCEKIFKAIDDHIKTPENIGKIVQKRTKGAVIKFNILPIIPNVAADAAPTKQ